MLQDLIEAFRLVNETNNQTIKAGQAMLAKMRSNINYPNLLFTCLKDSSIYIQKLRAAIELRIWCQAYKNMEEFERNSYQGEIQNIKTNILFAFLEYDHKIQKTLLPGIVSLTAVEFPDKWTVLISGLITYARQNPNSILKILELMVEITNKYSYLTRSDPLYHQIIIVCDEFHNFLLTLTTHSVTNILQNQSNPEQVKTLEQELILFYNLNYQDLHPLFEDNLKTWMQILKKVMNLPNNNENFFKCKGAALQSILLYASKYKDDVEASIRGFCSEIWELCSGASSDPEYDDVVFNALKYFRSLIVWADMKEFFSVNISSLISNLIIKNLALNANYKDLFNEDIETFISYFFKNCQLNSRRSASIQLLNGIVRNYKNYQQYLESQITNFKISDQNAEDQAILLTLVIESAARGFRDVDGVTMLQIKQNIITYCYENFIRNTLQLIFQKTSQNPNKPIEQQINLVLLLTTLRYIFYFRIYLPTDELNTVLKLCCTINTNNQSIRQVLILVVSSIVTLKHGNFAQFKNIVYYYDEQKINDVAGVIFGMIANYDRKYTKLNASLNRLFFSTVKQLKSSNQNFYESHLAGIIKSMLVKTSTFDFSSILPLFQALGYLTYYLCNIKSTKCRDLENITEQFFHQNIKSQSDILNFSFQILSIFLQFNPGNTDFYLQLYNSTIRTQNWTEDNISIMSSYLQYITAFIALDGQKIINDKGTYETILTKLIELDHYELFYRFLRRILKLTDIKGFCQYGYMNVLVQGTKFVSSRSLQGRKIGLLFLFEITNDYSTSEVVSMMNQVEQGFYENTLLNNGDIIQTLQVLRHRKLMFGSICNALVTGYLLHQIRCFNSAQSQAKIINMLVQNLSGRFKRDHLTEPNAGESVRKETTYQKLQVFKEIENINNSINLDEEYVLVEAYTLVAKNNPDVSNYMDSKNLQRLKKIYDKQNSQRQNK